MNQVEFDLYLEDTLTTIKNTLLFKSKEYSTDISRFHNFEEGKHFNGRVYKETVCLDYMTKHLVSIKDLVMRYEYNNILPNETAVKEKIGDAINYLILLQGMFVDRHKYQDVTNFTGIIKATKPEEKPKPLTPKNKLEAKYIIKTPKVNAYRAVKHKTLK